MKVCLLPQSTTSLKRYVPRATATGGTSLQVSAALGAGDVLAFGKPEAAGGAVDPGGRAFELEEDAAGGRGSRWRAVSNRSKLTYRRHIVHLVVWRFAAALAV